MAKPGKLTSQASLGKCLDAGESASDAVNGAYACVWELSPYRLLTDKKHSDTPLASQGGVQTSLLSQPHTAPGKRGRMPAAQQGVSAV